MGRLENIIARNQQPRGSRERFVVMICFGVGILIIIGLMVFTDLGRPPEPRRPASAPAAGSAQHGAPAATRVDGVLLRSPSPAAPARR